MTKRTSPICRRRAQTGLTLVEMLVAMVILGFIMTLVAEVVFQVSQVARAADSVTRGSAARWGSGWSANSLFANLLAPQEGSDDPPLTGSTRQITGFTSQPLDGSDLGIEKFELELRFSSNGEPSTRLISLGNPDSRANSEGDVVALYPGRAEFAYLDHSGRIQYSWPALTRTGQEVGDLPEAVMVRDVESGKLLMWYGFQGEIIKPKIAVDLFATPP